MRPYKVDERVVTSSRRGLRVSFRDDMVKNTCATSSVCPVGLVAPPVWGQHSGNGRMLWRAHAVDQAKGGYVLDAQRFSEARIERRDPAGCYSSNGSGEQRLRQAAHK